MNDDNIFQGLDPELALRVARMIIEYRDNCEIDLNLMPVRAWVTLLTESDED